MHHLLLVDMLGVCESDLPDVNDNCFQCDSWRPKGVGVRHVWGRSVNV